MVVGYGGMRWEGKAWAAAPLIPLEGLGACLRGPQHERPSRLGESDQPVAPTGRGQDAPP